MAILNNLIVHGSSRFLNGANFDTINAESIGASKGVFNELIATTLDVRTAKIKDLTADNAKVVGLLDVQGELHTNSWTNANIANIGGSFYISPTVEPTDGTTTISITRNSATSWTITATGTFATDFIKSGTATTGVAWPANSLVLITGNIVVQNMEYPLGTLKGTLSSAVTATAAATSKTITLTGVTDAQNNSIPSVLEQLYEINGNTNISGASFKNGKISLYKLGSYPIGIQMSSMGTSSNSLIDIYGGVSTTPTVRIGHLGGLSSYTDSAGNTRQPTGWGIYTDNGFFKGVIVADSGSIGHFTIDANSIYSGSHSAYNSNNAGIYLGRLNSNSSDYYIAGGPQAKWWLKSDGSAQIGAMTLSSAGVLAVPAANITGTLTASQVDVSGIITAGGIVTNTLTGGTFNTTDYIRVSTQASSSLTIGTSGAKTDWRIIAGKTFGVDKSGNLYATSANITGAITATSLDLTTNNIKIGTGSIDGLSTVATTGKYTDLTLTPDLTVYIAKDGVVGTEPSASAASTVDGFKVSSAGVLKAANAIITGKIFATSGTIAGWRIENSYLASSNATAPGANVLLLSPSGTSSSYTVAEQAKTGWMITAGTTFGVNKDGGIYATYGKIGGWDITASSIQTGNYQTANKMYFGTSGLSLGTSFSVTSAGVLTATNAILKTVSLQDSSGNTRATVDANGLTVKDTSGNTASIFGAGTATIGYISGNNYNINITGTDIDLRYNTSILNRINSSGMVLYDGNGIADSNKIASFGNTVTIGKQNVSQLVLSSGSIEGIGQNGLSYFMVNNDGANSVTFEYAKNYGPYTIASGANRSVSISTTTSSLSSGTYFEIKTIVNNADKTVKFKKGTASTRILYGTVIEGAYDGANTIVITNNAAGSRSVHIYTYIEVIGSKTVAYQFGEAKENVEFGAYAFLSGVNTEASGNYTHVEGHSTTANGDYAHAEGYSTTASGYASHAEGESTTIAIDTFYGHAEGSSTVVSGTYAAHAEGGNTTASGNFAHAEGVNSEASGYASHAEGSSDASGRYAHAEGGSTASGMAAHSEGMSTYAVGLGSHAGGTYSYANHDYSFVHGTDLISGYENQAVFGRYNKITIPTKTYLLYSCSASDEGQTKLSIDYSQWHFYLGDVAIYYNGDPFDRFTYDSQYIYINRVNAPDGDFYEGDEIEARVAVNDKAFIIGNGGSSARSNALTVDWNGNVIGQAMAGIIQMYAGAATQTITNGIATVTGAPDGWLICDGSELLKSEYPELAAALSNTWGTPSSSDYFKLPDLRGRAPIGVGTGTGLTARTLGDAPGSENIQAHTHSFTQPKTPNHTHTMTYVGDAASNISGTNPSNLGSVVRRTTSSSDTTNWTSNSTGGGVACTGGAVGDVSGASTGNQGNMQPSAVVNFIICTGKTS